MSFFRFTHTAERDDFWSGQAVMETKFSVGNVKAARDSKLNQLAGRIGNIAVNAENVGIQVNFLVVMNKSEIVHTGYTPPIIFDSLTGLGFKEKENKWDLLSKLSLVGRAQSSVNYQGTVPEQKDISVQVGGLAAVRLFMPNSTETLAWGDRLVWTVPDIGDKTTAEATYRHLNGLARAEFPKGKVPVLVEKMKERDYSEFPIAALRHFCEKSTAKRDYWNSSELQNSKDPLDGYIRTNFVSMAKNSAFLVTLTYMNAAAAEAARASGNPVVYPSYEIVLTEMKRQVKDEKQNTDAFMCYLILMNNFGLLPWSNMKTQLNTLGGVYGKQIVDTFETASKENRTQMVNLAVNQMAGQFDCFSHLRDRNFGKAMSVGRSGDGVKVLFRIT